MSIKWNALAQTAGISFVVTVAIVTVFALGIMALSRRETAVAAGSSGKGTVALAGASLCFAACAAAVLYGLSLIAA
ncbi:hypothetical protein [Kitasatospora sp. MAP5-34]|uniref:hypothetical protein n=1 Tax=Kitasatospora sp. MAP5-34 TaxID=3035102 RepID=UPI00247545B6|nr:hypothetical protein [Kitasatospora sp. MAP5-34]